VLGSSPSRITQPLKTGAFFMPFTYILFSQKLNKYYIGACIDMERRLYEHNIGHSKFTSTGIPWVLKYTERFETLTEAKKRELAIKKMKSRKYIESLFG
ncbi:MAG: GIY-YIG nuclease family protein, partial [Ginsengibacter sp.]